MEIWPNEVCDSGDESRMKVLKREYKNLA